MAAFQNQATLSYNGVTVQSNVVSGEVTQMLSISKNALSETYSDEPIVYAVSLVNNGQSPYSGVVLTDDLGGYVFNDQTVYPLSYVDGSVRYFLNGVLQPAPAVSSDAGLVVSGVNVPANGNAMVLYSALPTAFAPRSAGEGVTNTVTASGAGLSENISAEATVTAEEGPVLAIVKSLSPQIVDENGEISYTFVIENSGASPAEAGDNVALSDLFDPILSDLSVTLDGAPLSPDTGYTYDEASGQFNTVPGVITVPAAAVSRDPDTGAFCVVPGQTTLVVTGRV